MDDQDAQNVIALLQQVAPELIWEYRLDSRVPGLKRNMLWLMYYYEIDGQEYGNKLMVLASEKWKSPPASAIEAIVQRAREGKIRCEKFFQSIKGNP